MVTISLRKKQSKSRGAFQTSLGLPQDRNMARQRNNFQLEAQMGTLPESDTKNFIKKNEKKENLKNRQILFENGMYKRNDGQRQFER